MRISDWSSDVCSSDLVEATVGDIASSFERFRRLRSDEVDRAAGRVLPEQRTLRPLEDLDAFEIISLVEREDRERQRLLIEVDTHRRSGAQIPRIKAATADCQNRRVAGTRREIKPRRRGCNFLKGGQVALRKRFP